MTRALDVPSLVVPLIAAHPHVFDVQLVGSRADGSAIDCSDWDFHVITRDFERVSADLPGLTSTLHPLTQQWDPLARHANYMLILPSPVTKIDLIFDEPVEPHPPWRVSAETLPQIEAHFWDWMLWLRCKASKGRDDLVASELLRMHDYLLSAIGVSEAPSSLSEAVAQYLPRRLLAERRLGIALDPALPRAMSPLFADALQR